MDDFWHNVDTCLNTIAAEGDSVEAVIRILNEHFTPSAGVAFFGGSGGDRQLLEVLLEDRSGWKVTWSEADYYYVVADPAGNLMTYIEGDIERGDAHAGS